MSDGLNKREGGERERNKSRKKEKKRDELPTEDS